MVSRLQLLLGLLLNGHPKPVLLKVLHAVHPEHFPSLNVPLLVGHFSDVDALRHSAEVYCKCLTLLRKFDLESKSKVLEEEFFNQEVSLDLRERVERALESEVGQAFGEVGWPRWIGNLSSLDFG